MKITEETAQLVADLENIIGGKCYNSSSYNGYTGEYGTYYRYPVKYHNKKGSISKSRWMKKDIDLNKVDMMKYCFGANELYIGEGIIELLNALEKRFGIDFEELLENEEDGAFDVLSLFEL